jgi:hypothetical protein
MLKFYWVNFNFLNFQVNPINIGLAMIFQSSPPGGGKLICTGGDNYIFTLIVYAAGDIE